MAQSFVQGQNVKSHMQEITSEVSVGYNKPHDTYFLAVLSKVCYKRIRNVFRNNACCVGTSEKVMLYPTFVTSDLDISEVDCYLFQTNNLKT